MNRLKCISRIYVFLKTRWSVKTSIFLCHGIKRWYLREWSIMDAFLNTWYFIILHSNRFRFLVESGRSARDARELTWDQVLLLFFFASLLLLQKKKNPRASCALSLLLLGGCGAYLGAPTTVFCEISARKSKTCLEFSIAWRRLKTVLFKYNFRSLYI